MAESIAALKARMLVNALNPSYPLDVVWLASKILGKPVIIDQRDFPSNICAMIVDRPDFTQAHIGVNRNRTRASQRFGIVHELAHPYLEHRGNISFIEDEEDPVFHAEADDFATEMLAPKYRIFSLADRYREPLTLVRQIMRHHDVSLQMACRRVIELGIYQGAFLCFSESQVFFAYNSQGFSIDIDQVKSLPRLEKGCLISRQELVCGTSVTSYLQRFKSGNFLAAWIEDNPVTLYKNLVDKWLGTR
ncbi:MAG: ImmA/IrrE family metallo-endopeptidase [Thermoanaerobacteraceae bacterium]|nr:ImmA/IrrE family metallo-endopeptidase [Thermoanaerobacteraceae bacterium]